MHHLIAGNVVLAAAPIGVRPPHRSASWRAVLGGLLIVVAVGACGSDDPPEVEGLGPVADLRVADLDAEDARAVVEAVADAGSGATDERAALVAAEAFAAHRDTIADDALASGRGAQIFERFLSAIGPDEQAAAIAADATLAAAREQVAAVPLFPLNDRAARLAGAAAGSLLGVLAEEEAAGASDGDAARADRLADLDVVLLAGYVDAARASTDPSAVSFLDGVRAWAAAPAGGAGPVQLLAPVEGGEALVDVDALPEAERAATISAIEQLRAATGVPAPVRANVSDPLAQSYEVATAVFEDPTGGD